MTSAFTLDTLEPRQLMAFAEVVPAFGGGDGFAGEKLLLQPTLLEQSDGKILAVSRTLSPNPERPRNSSTVFRFNADGSLDSSFDEFRHSNIADNDIVALLPAAGGKTLGVYEYRRGDGTAGIGIFRFNANGALDTTYAKGGLEGALLKNYYFGGTVLDTIAAVGPDGALYVATQSYALGPGTFPGPFRAIVMKFTAGGQFDTTWGEGGIVTLPSDQRSRSSDPYARNVGSIIVKEGNTVLLAGTEQHFKYVDRGFTALEPTLSNTYVTRLSASGGVDTRFGNRGQVVFPDGADPDLEFGGATLVRQPDGKLLLGYTNNGRTAIQELDANARGPARFVFAAPSPGAFGSKFIQLSDGRLILLGTHMAELRRNSSGNFEAEPALRPIDVNGNVVRNLETVIVLSDGDLLGVAQPPTSGFDRAMVKLDAGSGSEPRDDFVPNAQQNSLTGTRDENGDYVYDLFFYDAAAGNLKYRHRDASGRWGAVETVDAGNNTGVYLSSFGKAVAYTDGDDADLKFATRNADGTWHIRTVDNTGGLYPSLVSYVGGYAIAYYHSRSADLRFATRNAEGRWGISTIDREGDVGRIPKLVAKQNGKLAVAYTFNGTQSIRVADQVNTPRGWTFATAATTAGGVGQLDLGYTEVVTEYDFDFDETQLAATVAYYDAGPADLVISKRAGLGKPFYAVRADTLGATGQRPLVADPNTVLYYDRREKRVNVAAVDNALPSAKFTTSIEPIPAATGVGPFYSAAYSDDTTNISSYLIGGYGGLFTWYDAEAGGLVFRDGRLYS